MSRCPQLDSNSTGWFSYEYICRKTGAKIGDDTNESKVENLCKCDKYYDCPVYKR